MRPAPQLSEDTSAVSRRFDHLGEDGVPCLLGIMGGTFDPIHLGHLLCAECARTQLGLAAVLFMPAGVPPWKQGSFVASAGERYSMVALAVEDNPFFDVSPLEVRRETPCYTVDTLGVLRAHYPGNVGLVFIGGADAIRSRGSWYGAGQLDDLATFAYAARGEDARSAQRPSPDRTFAMPAFDISSTMLRDRLSRGLSVRYLVPDAVGDHLERRGLYRGGIDGA